MTAPINADIAIRIQAGQLPSLGSIKIAVAYTGARACFVDQDLVVLLNCVFQSRLDGHRKHGTNKISGLSVKVQRRQATICILARIKVNVLRAVEIAATLNSYLIGPQNLIFQNGISATKGSCRSLSIGIGKELQIVRCRKSNIPIGFGGFQARVLQFDSFTIGNTINDLALCTFISTHSINIAIDQ